MIIKIISTQSQNDGGSRPYKIIDTERIPETERKQYLKYLKRNKAAGLLDYKILEG